MKERERTGAGLEGARILREREVRGLLGVSRTTLHYWRKQKRFPAPLKLGPHTIGWPERVVMDWLSQRPAA